MDKKFFKASDEMSHFHKEQEMKKYFICNDCDRAFPIEKYFGCPECGRKSDYIKQLFSENCDFAINQILGMLPDDVLHDGYKDMSAEEIYKLMVK